MSTGTNWRLWRCGDGFIKGIQSDTMKMVITSQEAHFEPPQLKDEICQELIDKLNAE